MLRQESSARNDVEQKLAAETQARLEAEHKAQLEAEKAAQAEEKSKSQIPVTNIVVEEKQPEVIVADVSTDEPQVSEIEPQKTDRTYVCDCCGQNTFTLDQLVKIDSGHLFCSECLAAMRR
jgi:peptide methionine sulfoxide reductase MsrB